MFCKFFFFVIFNAFVFNAFSQQIEWDAWLDFLKKPNLSYRDFEKFQLKFKNKELEQEGQISIQNIYHRPFSIDAEQHLFTLIKDTDKRTYAYYTLNIISKENEIIYIELIELDQTTPIVQNKSEKFNEILLDNQADSNIPADTTHEYYNPAHLIFVGFNCKEDYEFVVENEADKLKELVKTQNKTEILKWCRSLNPEIRCFGAIGLSYLKKNGILLNDYELDLLKKISKEQTLIRSCNQCSDGGILSPIREIFQIEKDRFMQPLPPIRA